MTDLFGEVDLKDQVREVYMYWREVMEYPTRKLTPARRTKIEARLKSYSVEQLKAVALFVSTDQWWRGRNNRNTAYDDIVNIYRNDERVDMLLGSASKSIRGQETLPKTDTKGERF